MLSFKEHSIRTLENNWNVFIYNMLDAFFSALCMFTHLTQQPCEEDTIIIPILQMKKLALRS